MNASALRDLVFSLTLATGLLAIGLVACSPSPEPSPPAGRAGQPAQLADAQAEQELAMYRSLLAQRNYEFAAPIGQEIAAKFAGTPAADEVQKTLADTVAKGQAAGEERRMQRLWSYQSGMESGGRQNTASIYSSTPAGAERVRLVLRRHSDWGRSVYLFGNGSGFACGKTCSIAVRFDDQPARRFKAYLPPTGEPALFIEDDTRFIAALQTAHKAAIDVTLKGKGKQTLVFEVGGYDPARFPALKKAPHTSG